MISKLLQAVSRLSDKELLERLQHLVARENAATADVVAHLVEVDKRRLYARHGSSLFGYCTRNLHLSEYAAYARIQAARFCRQFPVLLDKLSDGSINLTAIGLIGPHLTDDNLVEIVERATHRTKRDVEELVARLRPQADAPALVRRLPNPSIPQGAIGTALNPAMPHSGCGPGDAHQEIQRHPNAPQVETTPLSMVSGDPPRPAQPSPRALITPLAPERYKISFTAGAGTYRKLLRARDLLRHQIPDGDTTLIFDRALTTLLTDIEKKKLAAVLKPKPGARRSENLTRHIPSDIKRSVWARDGGRCAFVFPNGQRCEEQGWLEFHHVRPFARGGPTAFDNIELRCRVHNQYEAELVFGRKAN